MMINVQEKAKNRKRPNQIFHFLETFDWGVEKTEGYLLSKIYYLVTIIFSSNRSPDIITVIRYIP
jgi:hypothetical protein